MTYSRFIVTLLSVGAQAACEKAARLGVPGGKQAAWLNRYSARIGDV